MKNFKTYGQFLTEAYSDEERKELADKGFALSDGSFPIKDLKDLKNAIQAYGRAKDQERTAKFIVKRAKALGAEDLVPDTEDFQKSLGESVVTEAKAITEAKFKKGQYIKAKTDSDDFDGDVYDVTNDVDGSPISKNASFEIYKIGKDEIVIWSDEDEVEYSIDPDDLKYFVKESAITEGTDIGSWNQGGLKGDKNVLITTFVGPKDIEDFGLGRKCMQINVGMDYVSLNPADIVELKDILKSYKVK